MEVSQIWRIAEEIETYHPKSGLAVLGSISHLSEDASHIKEIIRSRAKLDLSILGGFTQSVTVESKCFWQREPLDPSLTQSRGNGSV